ncbi:hypothetical protein FPOAC2_14023 [Fusarium poae]
MMSYPQSSSLPSTPDMEPPCPGQRDPSSNIDLRSAAASSSAPPQCIDNAYQKRFSFQTHGVTQDSCQSRQLDTLLRLYSELKMEVTKLKDDNRKLNRRVRLCEKYKYFQSNRNRPCLHTRRLSLAIKKRRRRRPKTDGSPHLSSQVIPCTPTIEHVVHESGIYQTDSEDEVN